MLNDYRLVCDCCFAFRGLGSLDPPPSLAQLRDHELLGPFVVEHEDCRPPLRLAPPDDAACEGYREHYEEA